MTREYLTVRTSTRPRRARGDEPKRTRDATRRSALRTPRVALGCDSARGSRSAAQTRPGAQLACAGRRPCAGRRTRISRDAVVEEDLLLVGVSDAEARGVEEVEDLEERLHLGAADVEPFRDAQIERRPGTVPFPVDRDESTGDHRPGLGAVRADRKAGVVAVAHRGIEGRIGRSGLRGEDAARHEVERQLEDAARDEAVRDVAARTPPVVVGVRGIAEREGAGASSFDRSRDQV